MGYNESCQIGTDMGYMLTLVVGTLRSDLMRCFIPLLRSIKRLESGTLLNVTYMRANMGYMFDSASAFNQAIGEWDTSKVTDMYSMFGLVLFNPSWRVGPARLKLLIWVICLMRSINRWRWDIGWYVSFRFCIQPTDWDTSKVTDMNSMFYYRFCVQLESGTKTNMGSCFVDRIGEWDTSKVTAVLRSIKRGQRHKIIFSLEPLRF